MSINQVRKSLREMRKTLSRKKKIKNINVCVEGRYQQTGRPVEENRNLKFERIRLY